MHRTAVDSMAYTFESNAQQFTINYEISNIVKGYFPQIGLTAREGICIMYRPSGENQWFNIDCYTIIPSVKINMTNFVEKDEVYEIMVYGPIIGKLTKLEVEFPDDSYAEIINWIPEKTLCVAGGSNSFGVGCTTTGLMFSNILERKLSTKMYHVTYNDKNYLESIYNYYKNSNPPVCDVGILELDHYSQNESIVENLLPEVISLMNQRCKYLIGWYSMANVKSYKKIIANNTIQDFIYNNEIEIVDLSYLYNDEYREMCTYNNFYINDTGNMMVYKKLKEAIRRVTKWKI